MIRVVPDTNVRFSADLTYGGTAWTCIRRLTQHHRILTSEALLDEYSELLQRKTTLTPESIQERLSTTRKAAELVQISHFITGVCRDPDDHRVIECAVSGDAQWIISGDKDLLILGSYGQIRIISPVKALALLDALE